MDPVTIGMLGLGGMSMLQNLDKEQRDRKLAAETQRYSPWTQLRAQPIEQANPYGDLAQTGAGVLGYQQAQEAAALRKQLTQAQIKALGGRSPYSQIKGSQVLDRDGMGGYQLGDFNPRYDVG